MKRLKLEEVLRLVARYEITCQEAKEKEKPELLDSWFEGLGEMEKSIVLEYLKIAVGMIFDMDGDGNLEKKAVLSQFCDLNEDGMN